MLEEPSIDEWLQLVGIVGQVPEKRSRLSSATPRSRPASARGPRDKGPVRLNAHNIKAIRDLMEMTRRTGDQEDLRVGSPAYMPPQCRLTPEGCGGAPISSARPSSASSARSSDTRRNLPAKTERWRETGFSRWPRPAHDVTKAKPPSDGDPMFRGQPTQPNWEGELWMRSLRRPGVELQDAVHAFSPAGILTMHQEWCTDPPPPWIDVVPYGGMTSSSKVAVRQPSHKDEWVERPVSTGKLGLDHFHGQRYRFDAKDRGLDPDPKPVPDDRFTPRPPSGKKGRRAMTPRGPGAYF